MSWKIMFRNAKKRKKQIKPEHGDIVQITDENDNKTNS
jgi:hypothetical protein